MDRESRGTYFDWSNHSDRSPTTGYLESPQYGVSYFFQADDLGSTTTLTDASGTVVASYAYGNLRQAADTVGNPLRFTGLASDPTTGLIYARARYYDPATGRFLTQDPASCGSRPSCGCQGGSQYAYAGDNPVNRVDPSGKVVSPALFDGGAEMESDWEVIHYGTPWAYVPPGTPSSTPGGNNPVNSINPTGSFDFNSCQSYPWNINYQTQINCCHNAYYLWGGHTSDRLRW